MQCMVPVVSVSGWKDTMPETTSSLSEIMTFFSASRFSNGDLIEVGQTLGRLTSWIQSRTCRKRKVMTSKLGLCKLLRGHQTYVAAEINLLEVYLKYSKNHRPDGRSWARNALVQYRYCEDLRKVNSNLIYITYPSMWAGNYVTWRTQPIVRLIHKSRYITRDLSTLAIIYCEGTKQQRPENIVPSIELLLPVQWNLYNCIVGACPHIRK